MQDFTQDNAQLTFEDGKFFIHGNLKFSNVTSIYQQSLTNLNPNQSTDLHFDFSNLHSSDSAGLALIIEWIKFAKRQGMSITFTSLSDDLLAIAKASGMDNLIQEHRSA